MDAAVKAALAEIAANLKVLEPEHEGLRDYARLNLHRETAGIVAEFIVLYDRRVALLQAAQQALMALLEAGQDALGMREVSEAVLADLRDQRSTIEAAFAKFKANTAVALTLSAGPPEPKQQEVRE